ncbi:hypothetical protein KH5H1_45490 [Corallococcus caeni]|uniref:hypothetical protein n=1 Tax=Corallococcus caeni TaxID=3082388 RepID=UPI002956FEC0|nr:hypothetical protein KH5H1_45490 [Corallococcus sp. KH5-1]
MELDEDAFVSTVVELARSAPVSMHPMEAARGCWRRRFLHVPTPTCVDTRGSLTRMLRSLANELVQEREPCRSATSTSPTTCICKDVGSWGIHSLVIPEDIKLALEAISATGVWFQDVSPLR